MGRAVALQIRNSGLAGTAGRVCSSSYSEMECRRTKSDLFSQFAFAESIWEKPTSGYISLAEQQAVVSDVDDRTVGALSLIQRSFYLLLERTHEPRQSRLYKI